MVNLFYYALWGCKKPKSTRVRTKNKNNHKKFICEWCLNHFVSEKVHEDHLELRENHDYQRHVYLNENIDTAYFKQIEKLHKVAFVVYADFESFIKPVKHKIGNGTTQYQQHTPSGFCYTITCMDETVYKPKTVLLHNAKRRGRHRT